MEADHHLFGQALEALDAGGLDTLRTLLDTHPELVRARATSVEPPYDGYFHGATLLHHVAGNPIRGPLPDNVVEVARALLQAGAGVDAGCGGGPSQPGTGGGTTLGLVVTGARAHQQGHTEALLDLLLEHGAHLDPEGGMWGTLYHTVEHRGQRDVARMLHARGVRADLPTAAGLGRLDLVREMVGDDGTPVADADRIWRKGTGLGPGTPDQVLADAILAAAVNGWPDVVAWLLDAGAPLQRLRPWGPFPVTPLHGAAWAGWTPVVRLLLERGADPFLREPTHQGTPRDWARHAGHAEPEAALADAVDAADPEAAFRGAVEKGDAGRVRHLLERHAGAREALEKPLFSFDAPALVYASSRRDRDLMEALLDAGADIDALSRWEAGGFSALHHQVGGGHHGKPDLARFLLDRGATVDLHSAAGLGRTDLLARMLDAEPERVDEPGPDGVTPLHLALDVDTARMLLDRGANLERRCVDHNSTPAMWAIEERPEVMAFLVEQGATPDLFMAAVLDDVALAGRVLAAEPDAVRQRVREGQFAHPPEGGDIYIWKLDFVDTPAEVARLRGHEAVYRFLLERSPPGIRAVQAGREGELVALEDLLEAHPRLPERMSPACLRDLLCVSAPVLDLALGHGADPDAPTADGVTPLHRAAWDGDLAQVRRLLDGGADPLRRDRNHAATPLGWAEFNQQHEVVAYLKAHTDPDIVDATVLGMEDRVLEILAADPGQANGFPGASPLRAAAWMGRERLVEALLQAGADPRLPNPETGLDAVAVAHRRGFPHLARIMEGQDGAGHTPSP